MGVKTLALFHIFFAKAVFSQLTHIEDFTHIGSVGSTSGNLRFDDSDYYVSQGSPINWNTAQQSCRNLFGINATLVSIETAEEWEYLKIMLDPHGSANYWTSGMYDPGASVWRWSSNNLPFMAGAPWDNGHPASPPTSIHRVLIAFTHRYSASWRTVQNSQSHHYICELHRPPTEPITCEENDLIIVLDSSASIGSHNYKQAKRFAANLYANVTADEESRVGVLIYSDTVSVIVSLNNSLSSEEITNAILEAPYLRGNTTTHLAIDEAVEQFTSFPRIVPQNLVIITDGDSTNATLTAMAIETAVSTGIQPFAVGISPSANREELLTLADGDSDSVFSSDRCDELELLVTPLTRRICRSN